MNEKFVNVKNACTSVESFSVKYTARVKRSLLYKAKDRISRKEIGALYCCDVYALATYLIPKGATPFQTTITHYIWLGDSSAAALSAAYAKNAETCHNIPVQIIRDLGLNDEKKLSCSILAL